MSDKHQTPSYPLRISAELRSRLEDSARENKRSLNAEISARLEESFDPAPASLDDRIRVKGSNGDHILPPLKQLLDAAGHQYERMGLVGRQLQEIRRKLAQLQLERESNALEMHGAPEPRKEELRSAQLQLTSEIAALSMQAHMYEFEIKSAGDAMGFKLEDSIPNG